MTRRRPDDLHEWISFEDPTEHRTWVFDATYLRSNYTCIYGCGCKGILDEPAPELQQGRVAMLTLGTGLGGAIAERGRIVTGANSVAGHFGRMPVPSPWAEGATIPLEHLVSGSGLAMVANKVAGEPVFLDGRAVLDGCKAGHPQALLGLERFCDFLVMALRQIYWSLDPDCILVGGGLVEAREQWWPMMQHKLACSGRAIRVQPAQLHNDAGIYGAGALIRLHTGNAVRGENAHAG